MIASSKTNLPFLAFAVASAFSAFVLPTSAAVPTPQDAASTSAVTRRIGAVKAINGTALTLTPDSGSDLNVTVEPATRIVRIAPGEKDLKNATQIQLQDVQVGDRVLVGGKLSDDKLSLAASSVVVMKKTDLQARDQQTLQDWQKRGVDGLASAVDASAATIVITSKGKNVVIHTSSTTVIRRYLPDSVKFEDAKPSTLKEVHGGDQVRARGDRNADGTDVTAEEIVSGTFRNFAGTINSVDASSSTLSVHDLLSKKNVTIKVTPDSLLRKLPPEMAQMMAKRLKGTAAGAMAGAGPGAPAASDQHAVATGAAGGANAGSGG